jgi:UDP-N-acetylmuramate--alanine ligase
VNFTHRLPFYGRVMLCIDDEHVRAIMPQVTKPVTTYGFRRRRSARLDAARRRRADALHGAPGRLSGHRFVLNQPGMHNVLNACSAIAIAREIGIDDSATAQGLAEFRGVGRRFTRYGEIAARRRRQLHPGRRLRPPPGRNPGDAGGGARRLSGPAPGAGLPAAPLQPHARPVRRLRQGAGAPDVLVLAEVYAAGEAPIVAADGRALARALRAGGKIEPVFVERSPTCRRPSECGARRRRRAHHGRRLDQRRAAKLTTRNQKAAS